MYKRRKGEIVTTTGENDENILGIIHRYD